MSWLSEDFCPCLESLYFSRATIALGQFLWKALEDVSHILNGLHDVRDVAKFKVGDDVNDIVGNVL